MTSGYQEIFGPTESEKFTAVTFLDFLRLSNQHWWTNDDDSKECQWVFRGQANADWKLIPTAARQLPPIVEKAKQLHRESQFQSFSRGQVEAALLVQRSRLACDEFAEIMQKLNFIRGDFIRFPTDLKHILDNTNQNFPDTPLTFERSGSKINIYPLAQHHGIPTFLLDWTRKPEIAAFFAATADSDTRMDLAIYAIRKDMSNSHKRPYSFHTQQNYANKYLDAQKALLSRQMSPGYFVGEGRYISLDERLKGTDPENGKVLLKKIILPACEIAHFRTLIEREGLDLISLMPSISEAAKYVCSKYP